MPGVTVLTGDNVPDKEARLKEVLKASLPKGGAANALQVYHASEAPAQDIVADLSSGSLFGGSTVVLIRGCEEMLSDTLEQLAPYAGNPSPDNTLILEGSRIGKKISASHPWNAALKKGGSKVSEENFSTPPGWKIPDWVMETAKRKFKRTLRKEGAQLLMDIVGDDLQAIYQELAKLDIVLPDGAEIRDTDIRKFTAASKVHEAWDLGPPVARRETLVSLKILRNLFDYDSYVGLRVVSSLADHFIRLYRLRMYFDANAAVFDKIIRLSAGRSKNPELDELLTRAVTESGYAEGKRISVYPMLVLPKVVQQAGNYTSEQFRYIIRLMATVDVEIKSGGLFDSSYESMSRLVLYIIYSDRFRALTRY